MTLRYSVLQNEVIGLLVTISSYRKTYNNEVKLLTLRPHFQKRTEMCFVWEELFIALGTLWLRRTRLSWLFSRISDGTFSCSIITATNEPLPISSPWFSAGKFVVAWLCDWLSANELYVGGAQLISWPKSVSYGGGGISCRNSLGLTMKLFLCWSRTLVDSAWWVHMSWWWCGDHIIIKRGSEAQDPLESNETWLLLLLFLDLRFWISLQQVPQQQ